MIPHVALYEREAREFPKTLSYLLVAWQQIKLRLKPPGESGAMHRKVFGNVQKTPRAALSLQADQGVYGGMAPYRHEMGTKEGVVLHLQIIWAALNTKDGRMREGHLKQLMSLPYHSSIHQAEADRLGTS